MEKSITNLEYLHRHLLYEITIYLELRDLGNVLKTSKQLYNSLRTSVEG